MFQGAKLAIFIDMTRIIKVSSLKMKHVLRY